MTTQKQGMVAILDALGAAGYSDQKIEQFLRSREVVIEQLQNKAEVVLGGDANRIRVFIFNDTVLITLICDSTPNLEDIKGFGVLIRRFMVKSLEQNILFRGAISSGSFYVEGKKNTVMGEAVSDAAGWYELADWIGIVATPRTTMRIQSLLEGNPNFLGHLFVDYSVPLKDGTVRPIKAVNWPMGFFVRGMIDCSGFDNRRAKCLSLLTQDAMPVGTEPKYFNTLKYFDFCADIWEKERRQKKDERNPNKK
jgi:hypothetical protein